MNVGVKDLNAFLQDEFIAIAASRHYIKEEVFFYKPFVPYVVIR